MNLRQAERRQVLGRSPGRAAARTGLGASRAARDPTAALQDAQCCRTGRERSVPGCTERTQGLGRDKLCRGPSSGEGTGGDIGVFGKGQNE